MYGPFSLAQRFWAKVKKTDECWLWTGATNGRGYGQIRPSGEHRQPPLKAHRVSWEFANGPVPNGLFVLHRCDVRTCVNPDHLFLGTQADNMADCAQKRRLPTKLTAEQVLFIRESPLAKRLLARQFGVAHSLIQRIKKGESRRYG